MSHITKPRLDFVDLLKATAIYFVVIYHYNNVPIDFLTNEGFEPLFNYLVISVLSTCVPIFFLINGLLLLNRDSFDWKKHVIKMIKIVILVFVWGGITLGALSLIRNEQLSLSEFVTGTIYLKQGWTNHLWFLGALTVVYIFYPLLFYIFKTNRQIFDYFFVCVMLFTFGNSFLGNMLTTISFFTEKYTDVNLAGINYWGMYNPFRGIYGYAIGYFMLGGLFYRYKDFLGQKRFRNISIVGLVLSTLLLSLYGILVSYRQESMWDQVFKGYDSIFTLLNVIFILILSLKYTSKGKIGRLVTAIGKNSLGIYFTHIIIGSIFSVYAFQLEASRYLWFNILFAFLILLVSLVVCLLLKRIPVIRLLFLI